MHPSSPFACFFMRPCCSSALKLYYFNTILQQRPPLKQLSKFSVEHWGFQCPALAAAPALVLGTSIFLKKLSLGLRTGFSRIPNKQTPTNKNIQYRAPSMIFMNFFVSVRQCLQTCHSGCVPLKTNATRKSQPQFLRPSGARCLADRANAQLVNCWSLEFHQKPSKMADWRMETCLAPYANTTWNMMWFDYDSLLCVAKEAPASKHAEVLSRSHLSVDIVVAFLLALLLPLWRRNNCVFFLFKAGSSCLKCFWCETRSRQ